MWKGLKKALAGSHRSKAQKTAHGGDASQRSATSSSGAVFQLDLAELDGLIALHDKQQQQHLQAALAGGQQQQHHRGPEHDAAAAASQQPAPAAARTWAQLQAQLQQQHLVQQMVQQTDDSTSKRRAAALQKRATSAMLDPSACLYQISSLLALSTLFEHKLQRDTLQSLQQRPLSLLAGCSSGAPALLQAQQQQPQHLLGGAGRPHACPCQGCADASASSFCSACSGGPGGLRTPSATAASTAHVAQQLAGWGYRVIVRKVLHSKAYWTKAMDNTFIVALDSTSGSHVEYIVDPHFKEAFNVGVMSDNYSAVWHALPQVFVGMPCQLQSVVQLLCEEMELSFLEAGRPCPPWRGWAATINRWMSDQFVDILVPEPGAPPEEVAEFVARCTQFNGAGCGAASAAGSGASSSAATRSSSATNCGGGGGYAQAASTCSPLGGGGTTGTRLGDKVHVSSVLSSSSVSARERRVPEPLQQLRGFAAAEEAPAAGGAAAAAQATVAAQQQPALPEASVCPAAPTGPCGAGACQAQLHPGVAGRHGLAVVCGSPLSTPSADIASSVGSEGHGEAAHSIGSCSSSEMGGAGAAPAAPAAAAGADARVPGQATPDGCSRRNSSSSMCSDASGVVRRSRSLLTAQMQFRQQLEASRQRQSLCALGGAPLLQPGLEQQQLNLMHHQPAGAPQPHHFLLLQQQQQQQQQQALVQQLQQAQLALLQQQQQQQQLLPAALPVTCAPSLPVVHTVRPCGALDSHQQQQQQQQHLAALHAAAGPVQQQQQPCHSPSSPQLQASMHRDLGEQPKLLRLIHRPKHG